MENIKLKMLVVEIAKRKALQLAKWEKVRWEGGRFHYETSLILNEIGEYNNELKILYFESLFQQNFIIQDNLIHTTPDITKQVRDWILQQIANLKMKDFQVKNSEGNGRSKNKSDVFNRITSNPWIITIVGGLIITFLAKFFGWI